LNGRPDVPFDREERMRFFDLFAIFFAQLMSFLFGLLSAVIGL